MGLNNNIDKPKGRSEKGEDVLLQVAEVQFQKLQGTLFVLSSRISWSQIGQEEFAVSVYFADVDKLKVSPKHKAKKQLQIVLHNAEAFTFLFLRAEKAESDRDGVKEMIQQILPKFERKINSELEDKVKLLKKSPQLFKLYQKLVPTGITTAEEFWATRSSLAAAAQNTGVSSSFICEIQPSNPFADNKSSVHYSLKAETIQSIFSIYPSVRTKYEETVGAGQITEQQFWASFFHSHYVQRERLDFGSNELFAECASIDEKEDLERKQVKSNNYVPGDISNLEDIESGFFRSEQLDDRPGSSKGNKGANNATNKPVIASNSASQTIKALIKRTNQYSSRFLIESENESTFSQQPENRKKASSSVERIAVESKRQKIDEVCRLDDLSEKPENQLPELKIQGPEKFSQFGIDQTLQSYLPKTAKDVVEATNTCALQVQNWPASSESVINTIGTLTFNPVQDLAQISASSNGSSSSTTSDNKLTEEMTSEMHLTYAAAKEVLTNFWQCFPVDSPEKETKLDRSYESIQKYECSLLENFRKLAESASNSNCSKHLNFMMQQAHNKYSTFKNNKSRKR